MRHKHKCDTCLRVWEHERRNDVTEDEYHKLHNCPGCGRNQRKVHFETLAEQRAWDREKRDRLTAILDELMDEVL